MSFINIIPGKYVKNFIMSLVISFISYVGPLPYNRYSRTDLNKYNCIGEFYHSDSNAKYLLDTPEEFSKNRIPYPIMYLKRIDLCYPSIENVMTLFGGEKTLHPNKMNLLFGWFAGFWIHAFFQTEYKNLVPYNHNIKGFGYYPIYGQTKAHQDILRNGMSDGKIRMRNDKTPLRYSDINNDKTIFNMVLPENEKNISDYFLSGVERANVSPGHYVLTTLTQRNHNRICDKIKSIDPSLDSDSIFIQAQYINIIHIIKTVIGPYIENISGFINIKTPSYYTEQSLTRTFLKAPFEYNLAYQFHLLLPDKIDNSSQLELSFNTQKLYGKNIGEWLNIAINTQCYEQKLNNCSEYLKHVEQKAIQVSRKINLPSYCEYRRRLRLSVPTSFLDITGNDKTLADKLENVYKYVENVEFYVGMYSEKVIENGFFGETASTMLAIFAINNLNNLINIFPVNSNLQKLVDDFKYFDELILENLSETEQFSLTSKINFRVK